MDKNIYNTSFMPFLRKKMTREKCKDCYKKTRKNKPYYTKKMEQLKLVVFDMDGVLTDTLSSWKYVHDYFKTSNEKSVKEYIQGKISDMEFIKRDASLWIENKKPIKKERLVEILSDIKIMKGAEETIKKLKEKNIKTAIVSAGLDILADKVGDKLGIDYVYSNGIKTDRHGFITCEGKIGVKLMYKDETVKRISKQKNISLENITSVGNSCFDIPMFEITGLGIAFNPSDECVINAADIVIKEKNLIKIYTILDRYII